MQHHRSEAMLPVCRREDQTIYVILIILRSATKGNVREYRAIKYVWRIMQCNYEKTCYKSFEAERSRLRSRKTDLKNLKAIVAMSSI